MMPGPRRLAGAFLLLLFIVVYIFAAMLVAAAILPEAGPWKQLFYYAIAGLAWVPAAGWIISWMHRDGQRRPDQAG